MKMQSIDSRTFKLQVCYCIDYRENSLNFTLTSQLWRQRKKKLKKIKYIFRNVQLIKISQLFFKKKTGKTEKEK